MLTPEERAQAVKHMEWCLGLVQQQLEAGEPLSMNAAAEFITAEMEAWTRTVLSVSAVHLCEKCPIQRFAV
jgi:hypothetical protein